MSWYELQDLAPHMSYEHICRVASGLEGPDARRWRYAVVVAALDECARRAACWGRGSEILPVAVLARAHELAVDVALLDRLEREIWTEYYYGLRLARDLRDPNTDVMHLTSAGIALSIYAFRPDPPEPIATARLLAAFSDIARIADAELVAEKLDQQLGEPLESLLLDAEWVEGLVGRATEEANDTP